MAQPVGRATIPFFACLFLLVAIVLQIIAFAAPYWASDDHSDFGLWRYAKCVPTRVVTVRDEGCSKWVKSADVKDWLMAVRGMECLTLIFWSFPLVIVPIYMYTALGLYYRGMMAVMTLLAFLGAATNAIGIIVFGIKSADEDSWDLEWCFVVAIIACVLGFLSFIIFLLSCIFKPVFASQTHFMSGFYVAPDKNRLYVVENVDYPKAASIAAVNPAATN